MLNKDFYPTPEHVIQHMLYGYEVHGKTVLEPSAGSGNIVDYLNSQGAKQVLACEIEPKLRLILDGKCRLIANDFLTVTPEQISHVDLIVMNPPFSGDETHILHAWEIAPAGCAILALCNTDSSSFNSNMKWSKIRRLIKENGNFEDLGRVFKDAERSTDVEVSLIRLHKPTADGIGYDGFFLDEDPEQAQFNGLMPYNFARDLVNRYVSALKMFDQQLDTAVAINQLTSKFFRSKIGFSVSSEDKNITRNDYKKELQKSAWQYVFNEMNMDKYVTSSLRSDINDFVESQSHIPFTMRNIYRMLEIIVGTHDQRMDRAIMDVADRLTQHYHENRFNVEGWKTNSHYMINKKFILPHVSRASYRLNGTLKFNNWGNRCFDMLYDLHKALNYLTASNVKFGDADRDILPNEWFDCGFFRAKLFKKGTGHFQFKDEKVWAMLNQRIAKILGFPLPEKF